MSEAPKQRRDVLSQITQLFPNVGSTVTVESLIGIFGSKTEVRRVLGQYGSPVQSTKNWMNLVFVPGEHALYRREAPTGTQEAEAAYWLKETQPMGRPAAVRVPKNLIVFERLADGNFKPVEVNPEIAVKLKEFADAKKAAETAAAA